MTAVHLIVTSFPVFSPPTPGPPVSVLLCCFKICMSLRNASHGSKLCVSQPPTWWNDPFKAGSICLNLHSSSLSKASWFRTQPRNILIKAHDNRLFSTWGRSGWMKSYSVNDGWTKIHRRKRKKVRLILTHLFLSFFFSLSLSHSLLSFLLYSFLHVCVCLLHSVLVCSPDWNG